MKWIKANREPITTDNRVQVIRDDAPEISGYVDIRWDSRQCYCYGPVYTEIQQGKPDESGYYYAEPKRVILDATPTF